MCVCFWCRIGKTGSTCLFVEIRSPRALWFGSISRLEGTRVGDLAPSGPVLPYNIEAGEPAYFGEPAYLLGQKPE